MSIVEDLARAGIDLRGYEEWFEASAISDAEKTFGVAIANGEWWLRGSASWFLASNQMISVTREKSFEEIDLSSIGGVPGLPVHGLKRDRFTFVLAAPVDADLGEFEFMLALSNVVVRGKCFISNVEYDFRADSFPSVTVEMSLIGEAEQKALDSNRK